MSGHAVDENLPLVCANVFNFILVVFVKAGWRLVESVWMPLGDAVHNMNAVRNNRRVFPRGIGHHCAIGSIWPKCEFSAIVRASSVRFRSGDIRDELHLLDFLIEPKIAQSIGDMQPDLIDNCQSGNLREFK